MELRNIILIIVQLASLDRTEAVSFAVFGGIEGSSTFECGSGIVLSCNGKSNPLYMEWQIADTVVPSTDVAARCFRSPCTIYNNFSGRYDFTYDKSTGVSNLTINPVRFDDNATDYKCDDSSNSSIFEAFVKKPPDEKTTAKSNTTVGNDIVLSIETACIYPVQDIIVEWYSVGVDTVQHKEAVTTKASCNTSTDCILANKSAKFTSVLNLSKLTLSNMKGNIQRSTSSSSIRLFEVVIKYDSSNTRNVTITIGNFSVQDTTTLSTTTTTILTTTSTQSTPITTISTPTTKISTTKSAYSSPPSSLANITTNSSTETSVPTSLPIPGPTKKEKSDKTSTILISAISSMAGIILLLIVVFVVNKIRQKHNEPSDDTNMYEMKNDTNKPQ